MKEMKSYIHLYIGCKVCDIHNDAWILAGFTESEVEPGKAIAICKLTEPYDKQVFVEFYAEEVKLILRPLESMTEDEAQEIGWFNSHENEIEFVKGFSGQIQFESDTMLYLLKKGFDLFGLKEAGLAVYEE